MAHKTLCIGPAGSGKTQFAISMLRQVRLGRAIVLVPDAIQKYVVKTRIQSNRRVRVHQFSSLAHLILRTHRADVADLGDTMQRMLLRAVIRNIHASGQLPTFASVCHKPGFIATVGQLIAEMQDAEVPPDNLTAATVTPYDVELGRIYSAYIAEMETINRADRRRLLSLARDNLHNNPHLLANLDLFIVDGFDQFTPLQLSLLTKIANRVHQSIITLTGEESRMRPAHRRFQRTRTHLEHTYQPDDIRILVPLQPSATVNVPTHPTLAFLERHLFNLDTPAPLDANGALTVIETADRTREVRAALRHVRRLIDASTDPEHIAIFFRKRLPYAPLLREIAQEYALPLALYDNLPLIEVPSIIAMLTLFRLRQENYPRRMLVETWRSFADGRLSPEPLHAFMQTHNPNIPIPVDWEHAASMLDRVAHDSQIATGISRLQTLLHTLAQTGPIAVDTTVDEDEFAPTISADNAAHLHHVLDAFHTWLKPPTKTTLDAHVAWVRERIVCTFQSHDTTSQVPQPDALLTHILEELQQATHTLNEPPVPFATFLAELTTALSSTRYGRQKLQPATIAALPVIVARAPHFDHVILLGMVEGEFPLAMTNPPLYTHRERSALAQQGITIPPPDQADERSLFYETITRARRSLTLTRTYLDERGNTLPASPYLTALLDLVQPASVPLQRIGAGSVPTIHEAASPQEMLVAIVKTAHDRQGAYPTAIDHDHHTTVPLLEHVVRACAIEQDREGTSAYGPFEGMLHDEVLIADIKNHFGSEHRWSITQFNDYRTCPFRFAASHILRLKQRGEPEEGIESVGRGRIYHAILAKAGETWKNAHYPFSAQQEQPIIQALHDAADDILAAAPVRYGFRPGAFWHWEQADIRRRLIQAVRRALYEGGDWTAFHVVEVEKTFGMGSTTTPLDIHTHDGTVQVIGRVDRIDERDDGSLALIDYKSTSTVRPLKETLSGQDVQMPIYLMAVEHIIKPGQQVERAGFFHLGSGKYSSPLTDDTRAQAHDAMIESVTETVRGVHAGVFVVRPRDRCPTGCMYTSICRLNLSKKYLFGGT